MLEVVSVTEMNGSYTARLRDPKDQTIIVSQIPQYAYEWMNKRVKVQD